MKIPCSVPLLTLNNQSSLRQVLPLILPIFEDVYIMDGNSTDGTQAYARSCGVRVERQFDSDELNLRITDFYEMRLRLWSKAKCSWLFLLDSDEIPTSELLSAVRNSVAQNDIYAAHRFIRMAQLPDGRIVRHAFFYPDRQVRLFNVQSGITLAPRAVHERLIFPPRVHIVDHTEVLLAPWASPIQMWKKYKRYIALEGKSIQLTWWYLIRWILYFNFRSSLGQIMRALRAWLAGWYRKETSLPFLYTFPMILYRFLSAGHGVKTWLIQRWKIGKIVSS